MFEYIVNEDGTATITGYKGTSTSLVVPDVLDGYKVTAIGDSAFYECRQLASVALPQGLTTIGKFAFDSCSNLASVTLPQTLTTIDHFAFQSCSSLTSVMLPQGLISIGDWAFGGCGNLSSFNLPQSLADMGANPFIGCFNLKKLEVSPDSAAFSIIDGVLFHNLTKTLVYYPSWKEQTNYTIPQGINVIGDFAFLNCSNLTSVTLPQGLTTIGISAFQGCSSLVSVTLPQSLMTIDDFAFWGCSSLISVTLPQNLTRIGANPFRGCFNLKKLEVSPDSAAFSIIDGVLFHNSTKTLVSYPAGKKQTSYTIPQGISVIGNSSFANCNNLAKVTLPQVLSTIGACAFEHCSSLTSVNLPQSLTEISPGAFWFCESLKNVIVRRKSYAEEYCKKHNLPITYITTSDQSAPENSGSPTSATPPQSPTEIAPDAFAHCKSSMNVTFPQESDAEEYCKRKRNGFALALTKIAQTVRGWLKKAK